MNLTALAKLFTIFIFALNVIYFSGCNRDDIITPPIVTTSSDGTYILSEGVFGVAQSSKLSFYNTSTGIFSQGIFNPGNLGVSPDGLLLDNKNLYITEQGNFGSAGKIYKTDTNGTVISSSDAGTNPYSLTAANNKLYLTNGPANNVSVVNKSTLATITTIDVGLYPQEILAIGNKVFVCNTSVFGGGTDSTVSVIDATVDAVIATITVRKTPSSLAVTNDGKLLIGCPGSSIDGIIYKYDPSNYSRLDSFVIANGFASGFDKDISVDVNSNTIYFISYLNNIVRLDLNTREAAVFISHPDISGDFFYGYKYDSKNVKHFVADAKGFTTAGSVYVYDGNAALLKTFTAGYAPRRIVVKDN